MNSTINLDELDPRTRGKALRRMTPRDEPCAVPGCCAGRVTADCCYQHSLAGKGNSRLLPNDGIIDWVAVDVAARGLRRVRLTWVERDIAIGRILAEGGNLTQAERLTGGRVSNVPDSPRVQSARRIAEYLMRTGNGTPDA